MSCRNVPNPLLVEDILLEVFESLTLRDRKNARLVCKLWFDVCDQPRFAKKEAFYISLAYDHQTVADVLNNSRKATFNLKFCSCRFDLDSLPLWKSCGERIESLTFNKCTFHVKIIPRIFGVCLNLIEFHLRYAIFVNDDPNCEPAKLAGTYEARDSALLPRKNVVRKQLTTLCLKLNQNHDSSSEFQLKRLKRFASAFPALKTFKLITFHDKPYSSLVYWADIYLPTFSTWIRSVATQLTAVENLDLQYVPRFNFNSLKPRDLSDFARSNFSNFNNLKKVSLPLDNVVCLKDEHRNEYLNTILSFKFWTCFTIDCESRSRPFDLTSIAKLIEGNPQLEKLCVRFSPENVAHVEIFFAAVITSHLQSIVFDVPLQADLAECYASEIDLFLEPLPVNNSVRRFEIYHLDALVDGSDDSFDDEFDYSDFKRTDGFCSFCMKYFRNVHYLNAQPGDPDVIFKYQTNLKQLEMKFTEEFVLPSETAFIVESLEVLDIRPTVLDILSVYQFPNLKCLVINDFSTEVLGTPADEFLFEDGKPRHEYVTRNFVEGYNRISELIQANAPNVEFLHVNGHPFLLLEAYRVFFKSCTNFPKLRYASMSINAVNTVSSKEDVKAELLKYMPQCPLLRIVRFQTWEWTISLVFDIIDKTFKLSDKVSESYELYDKIREFYKAADLKNFFFYKR